MIRAVGVRKRRGGRDLVSIDALDFASASVTSVIGPSGAGKTTLLRILSLVDEPDTGEVEFAAHRYVFPRPTRRNPEIPWPHITAVFQDLWLWDHLDLKTNIRLPTERNRRSNDERFAMLVEKLDVAHLVNRYPHQVSGGERQRVAIARALMQRPTILFLDEPTSASDVEHSHRLAELLRFFSAEEQLTIVVVTHHLGFAARISDRVVFLDQGKVLQAGPVEILTAPDDERVKRFVSIL